MKAVDIETGQRLPHWDSEEFVNLTSKPIRITVDVNPREKIKRDQYDPNTDNVWERLNDES